jgi:hypothetical protein
MRECHPSASDLSLPIIARLKPTLTASRSNEDSQKVARLREGEDSQWFLCNIWTVSAPLDSADRARLREIVVDAYVMTSAFVAYLIGGRSRGTAER